MMIVVRSMRGDNRAEEMVTMVDNRNLRAIIHNITGGVFLTKAEYIEICKIIDGACERSIREEMGGVV